MEESNHLDINSKPAAFTDKQVFTKIWSQPRLVFKYLHEYHDDKHTHILLILAGIGKGLDRASTQSMGDRMPLLTVLALTILAGGAFGWMTYNIYAALMSGTGKWLKGKANSHEILRVLAYAMIPMVAALLIVGLQLAIFGNRMFQSEMDLEDFSLIAQGIYYVSPFVEITLGIWTVCLAVVGISEIQKFSIGKSILNLMLPGLLIAGIIFMFVLALE